ncbi:MAG: M48 family metallopeptidase [Rhodobacter sp.]|nr:M48 family metallopeptidase [Rhodobacter sp.]
MTQAVLPGDPPIEISLRRSARARRVSLRVSGLDGRVTLSMPKGMDAVAALAFAEEKSDWIRQHLAKQLQPVDVAIGETVPLHGTDLTVVAAPVRRAQLGEDTLLVPAQPGMAAARIKAFLKLAARDDLTRACAKYTARLGREFGRITLRDTRSRWGSCTAAGDLMFSWRLVMAPPDVLDYVAAHEVAHLAELNHSPAYWAVVGRICPGYRAPRQWLRQNGQHLHRYRFGD